MAETKKPAANPKTLTKTASAAARTSAVKKPRAKRETQPTVAVFIDVENTNASRDNLTEIFNSLSQKGKIAYGKFYGYRYDKSADFDEIVAEHRLETVGRMRFKDGEDSVVDARLVVDCVLAAQAGKYDFVFVWAGVGDLMSLFACIRQAGSSVVTVDMPIFDSTNKFVDQKIKLFSPHSLRKRSAAAVARSAAALAAVGGGSGAGAPFHMPTPIARAASVPAVTSPFESIIADRTIPKLPRKKGAPEFGKPTMANAVSDDDDGAPRDDDDTDDIDFDNLSDEELEALANNLDNELDDFDDLGGGGSSRAKGAPLMSAAENEKLLALSEQMLRAMADGKKFDVEKAAKAYDKSAAAYDPNDSAEAPSDKLPPESAGGDDFSDFGNL